MTIILRLQGLDVKAGTEDIRTFFESLHIPDGGVYIVGGRLREAFIAFTNEKDAQLAMRFTGKPLKGSKVTLHISSMEELEDKLKSLLKKKKKNPSPSMPRPAADVNVIPVNASPQNYFTANQSPPTAWPSDPDTANLPHVHPAVANLQSSNVQLLPVDSSTAFLLGVCTVLQGLQSSLTSENSEAGLRINETKANSTVVSDEGRTPRQTVDSGPGYVRLFGLPASTTKDLICQFFKGLTVQEAIVNVDLGRSRGCLVKFANMQDACDALRFNQQPLGPNCVEVRAATEKMWTGALQECDVGERVKSKQSPLMETANHRQKNSSEQQIKRRSDNQLPTKSPKKPRPDADSTTALTPTTEYTIMVKNLPKEMTKTEIKELFGCPNLSHKNVLHLLDKEGNRTDTAFLIFNRTADYEYAMNLSGCHVGSEAVEVSSTTIMAMRSMMAETRPRGLRRGPKTHTKRKPNLKRKSDPVETPEEEPCVDLDPAAQTCLFVRNLPADVKTGHVRGLFGKYNVRMDNITLLRDSEGKGIGEAVVRFNSKETATLAQRLHGHNFLGTKVLLTSISVTQMEDILARNV